MTSEIFAIIMILLLVLDPFGNIPFFLTGLKDIPVKRRPYIIVRESVIAFVILLIFMFIGKFFLRMFSFNSISLGIAGGIILFLISIKMVFGSSGDIFGAMDNEKLEGEPLIVPLAVPLIAGPSAMATVILFVSKTPEKIHELILALSIAFIISTVILVMSSYIERVVGRKFIVAAEKLMGLVLTAIAVDMFLNGLVDFIKYLKTNI